jgi:hypothetical protein
MSASLLWQRIRHAALGSVAVMGMTKNTGKTVVLNHLLAQAAAARVAVGLTSIGRDGEERDQVFSFPKPPVTVWPGALVATASGTLMRAKVRCKPVAETGIDSPMGEIRILRVLEHGSMEVAGASRNADQLAVMGKLKACGCELVLLDGALGRSHHASPALADGVILATGAVIGGAAADVLRKTQERLALLTLPPAPPPLATRCREVFAEGGVAAWGADGTLLLREGQATLSAAALLHTLSATGVACVALSGAVGQQLWRALLDIAAHSPGLDVVVADGTKLFVGAADLRALAQLGARLNAWRAIHIVGVALNPTSPFDAGFAAAPFLQLARAALPGHAVTDVVLEQAHEPAIPGVSA